MVHCTLLPVANWELCKVHDLPCHDKEKKKAMGYENNKQCEDWLKERNKQERERKRKNIFALKAEVIVIVV